MPPLSVKQKLTAKHYDQNLMDLESAGSGDRYGPIPGIELGTEWVSREDCSKARIHRPNFAGIAFSKNGGAYSVCVSGGYKDDVDEGDTIIYTGTGGQEDSWTGNEKVVADQSFTNKYNLSLKTSVSTRNPVRVIRGSNLESVFAPFEGYRYDGLYIVTEAKYDETKDGYKICRYKLEREPGQDPIPRRDQSNK